MNAIARPSALRPMRDVPASVRMPRRAGAAPALRGALRVLASQSAIDRAAGPGLGPVRRLLDDAFKALDAKVVLGMSPVALADARGRLADDLMIGLLHLVRASLDRRDDSAMPPLAVLALGEYGRRCWSREPLALLLLLPDDPPTRARAERIAAGLRRALIELAIPVAAETATVGIIAERVVRTPNLRARLETRRHLWGRTDLPTALAARLGETP